MMFVETPYYPVGEHPECNHSTDDGCMWCCPRCNTDTHLCPGCGLPTLHRYPICKDCMDNDEEKDEDDQPDIR